MPTQKTIKTGKQYRSIQFTREAVNEDERSIDLSFASEDPVDRWFGLEILDHRKKSIRLDRLKTGGPLLMDHNTRDQIGVIESVTIDSTDRKSRAVVRFGKSARAEEVYQDVLDGIRGNISVGYVIHRLLLEEEVEDGPNIYRAVDWEPYEISLVSVPADTTVGVGRAAGENNRNHETIIETPTTEDRTMPEKTTKTTQTPAAPAATPPDVSAIRAEAEQQERSRVKDITTIGQRFKQDELARQFIDNGKSIDEFRQAILEQMGKQPETPAPEPIPRDLLSNQEQKEYSIIRGLRAVVSGNWDNAGLEREVNGEISKRLGRDSEGIFVPTSLNVRAPLTAGTAADGGYTVQTTVMSIIELLRNRMMVRKLGAKVLSGLSGKLSFPKQLTSPTLNWSTENPGVDTADFDATNMWGQVALEPKMAIATVPYSKQMLAESSADVEQFVRDDLAKVNALGVDQVAINGASASNQPVGILNTSGIGAVAIGANGGAPTYAHMINLETEVAIDNADIGALAYLTNAKVRGKLKQTDVGTDTGRFVWGDGDKAEPGFGMINGYRAAASGQVPSNLDKGTSTGVCSAVIFGNWEDMLIGEWGVMELLADPYALKKQGLVEITSTILVDLAIRHPQSFAAIVDALTA